MLLDASTHDFVVEAFRSSAGGVSEGMTNPDIASRLGHSEHTVKNYIFRTFKLWVSNRAELILYAINHGCAQDACPHHVCEECTISTKIELPAAPAAGVQKNNDNMRQNVKFGNGTVRRA